MKTELDTDGLTKICWAEFEPCLKFFSPTSPFYLDAKKKYHESIQILLGRIAHLEEQRETGLEKVVKTIALPTPEKKDELPSR